MRKFLLILFFTISFAGLSQKGFKKIFKGVGVFGALTISKHQYNNLDTVVDYIIKEAATVTKTNRVSFWKYDKDLISCKNIFSVDNQNLSDKNILDKESYPIYFETLKNKAIINAPDVFNKLETSEFQKLYFTKNHIKSMLDVPIFSSGQLGGVVCFESTQEKRDWDNEDIN